MSDTIQKYKDYVMTGFMKSVVPIVIDKASGSIVTDVNGREYLDCFAGISVVSAGHNNPQVLAAAKAQMERWCTALLIFTTWRRWRTSPKRLLISHRAD